MCKCGHCSVEPLATTRINPIVCVFVARQGLLLSEPIFLQLRMQGGAERREVEPGVWGDRDRVGCDRGGRGRHGRAVWQSVRN